MNKLGYHVNTWTDGAKGTVRTQRNGAVLKVISTAIDSDEISRWKRGNRSGLVVFREYIPNEDLTDSDSRCHKLLADVAPIKHLVDVVETPWNEAHQTMDVPNPGTATISDYSAATVRAVGYIKARWPEVQVAVGNFSVGNPPGLWYDWEKFLPALAVSDYLSLHEYGAPYVWSEPGDPLGERREMAGGLSLGWWNLRYRQVWNWLTEHYPELRRPILITECGRDHGLTQGAVAGWRAHGGNDPFNYAEELHWYASELAKDRYVHGATIYACGTYDDFASFDIASVGEVESAVNEAVNGPPLWYPDDVAPLVDPSPISAPPVGDDTPAPAATLTETERYAADVFDRSAQIFKQPIHFNPGGALCRYWAEALMEGRFLGFPMESEHDSEDGKYVVQAFASTIVSWDKATGAITEVGYRPPLGYRSPLVGSDESSGKPPPWISSL